MTNDDNDRYNMMNIDEKVDYLKYYVGKSYILEYLNPPILSIHVSSLTMSNFDAYMHNLKKFQCCPHSLLTMQGQSKMTFVVGE
jgi:hypothetical protein